MGHLQVWTSIPFVYGVRRERRYHARVPLGTEVLCERQNGQQFHGIALDVCMGGIFIEAPELPGFGEMLRLHLDIPGHARVLVLPVVVRWWKPGGFGVQFGLLGARETHTLTLLLEYEVP